MSVKGERQHGPTASSGQEGGQRPGGGQPGGGQSGGTQGPGLPSKKEGKKSGTGRENLPPRGK